MSEVLVRVVALGATAAERGGAYCALCFATRADRRLVSPRHLQRLVQQLAGYMAHLAPMASSLTWGARACAWCEARCAAACRVLHALDAAASAHALLSMLDTGQDVSGLEKQMGEVEAALGRARGAALRCTDVLLIDTLQPVMELVKNAPPARSPHRPPAAQDIETVVIEDDPPECPPPGARGARGPRRRPSPNAPSVPVRIAPAPTPGATPTSIRPLRVTSGPHQGNTARKTFPASHAAQKGSPAGTSAALRASQADSASPSPLRTPTLSEVPQNASPMLVQALVAPPAAPAEARSAGAPAAPLNSDAVLMVLPPGAQIISRLDGVGPKYLLLNPPDPAPPAPLVAPSTPLAAPPTALAPLSAAAAAPGSCTVSCESDSDSNDSILLSQLIQRRDEFNRKNKNSDSDKNNTKTNNNVNNSFNFYNTGNSKCYITDVKSLSEEKSNSVTETSEQCFITDVKSLSADSESGNKRTSEATRQSKKAKGDGYEEERARAPLPSTDRVDWEDKIPMDVISFMDATDPCAGSFLPPKAAVKLLNHSLGTSGSLQSDTPNKYTVAPSNNMTQSEAQSPARAPSVHSYVLDAQDNDPEGPRPLALISNVTSASGEKSVVIDLC